MKHYFSYTKFSKSGVCFILQHISIQMLNSYMWLVAILLLSTIQRPLEASHFNLGDRDKSIWFFLFYKRGEHWNIEESLDLAKITVSSAYKTGLT